MPRYRDGDDERAFSQSHSSTVPIAMPGGYSDSAPVLHPASNPDDLQEEVSRGGTLFAANCASCHGSAGRGDGEASASLLPKPANLTAARFSDERLSSVAVEWSRWVCHAALAPAPHRRFARSCLPISIACTFQVLRHHTASCESKRGQIPVCSQLRQLSRRHRSWQRAGSGCPCSVTNKFSP